MMSGRRFSSAFIALVFPTPEAPIRKQSLCMLFRLFTERVHSLPPLKGPSHVGQAWKMTLELYETSVVSTARRRKMHKQWEEEPWRIEHADDAKITFTTALDFRRQP